MVEHISGPVSEALKMLPESDSDERRLRLIADWQAANATTAMPTERDLEVFAGLRSRDENERSKAMAESRVDSFIRRSVGERYRNASLDTYAVEHEKQAAVVAALRDYQDKIRQNVKAGRGVVLYGPSGTGKDHLLIGMCLALVRAGANVEAVSGPRLASQLRQVIDGKESEDRLFERYVSPHVLLLSDPVPSSGSLTAFQSDGLYRIIDDRYRNQRATWVTLNVSGGREADERLGSAIVDRLRDGALCLRCDWPSYRKPFSVKSPDGSGADD